MDVLNQIQPANCAGMEDIRREIDALDQAVITLLGRRFQYVLAASKFKTLCGLGTGFCSDSLPCW